MQNNACEQALLCFGEQKTECFACCSFRCIGVVLKTAGCQLKPRLKGLEPAPQGGWQRQRGIIIRNGLKAMLMPIAVLTRPLVLLVTQTYLVYVYICMYVTSSI